MAAGILSAMASPVQMGFSVRLRPMPPPEQISAEAARAAWRAEHPIMSPQQALASNAELGAPTGGGRDDNTASKIHTEIKVNGRVIARAYNSGGVEIADEYAFLSDELGFNDDTMVGPDLAEDRANRIKMSLQRHGASLDGGNAAASSTAPLLEVFRAATAQTQLEWLAAKASENLDPGELLSRSA